MKKFIDEFVVGDVIRCYNRGGIYFTNYVHGPTYHLTIVARIGSVFDDTNYYSKFMTLEYGVARIHSTTINFDKCVYDII
jgi:hypothetical protein